MPLQERPKLTDQMIRDSIKISQEMIVVLEEILYGNLSMKQICINHGFDIMRTRRLIEQLLRFQQENDVEYEDLMYSNPFRIYNGYEELYQVVFNVRDEKFITLKLPCDYKETVDFIINNLGESKKKVLLYRYGLQEEEKKTLTELKQILNMSKESICTIEAAAIQIMRSPRNLQMLKLGLCLYRLEKEQKKERYALQRKLMQKAHQEAIAELKQRNDGNLSNQLKLTRIETLKLSNRSLHCLHNANIKTVYDLLCFPNEKLMELKGLGKTSCREILSLLDEYLSVFGLTKDIYTMLFLGKREEKGDEWIE